ncbi:MAG TPA: peptidase M23 [Chromatiales bacterium]|nr:peptidase M23 [Thiotrichales bacterium]HIP68954.1 peptidase M23 [Chromatiales bacterium]
MHYGTDFKHKLRSESRRPPRRDYTRLVTRSLALVAGIAIFTAVVGISPDSSASVANAHHTEPGDQTSWVTEPLPLPGVHQGQQIIASANETLQVTKPETNIASNIPVTRPASDVEDIESLPWIVSKIKKGDSPSKIFSRHNIHSDLLKVIALAEANEALKKIRPGQIIKLNIDQHGLSDLLYEPSKTERLIVHREDDKFTAELIEREIETRQVHTSGVITDSLFASASRAGMSDSLIMKLAEIFAYDIDFALDIREGDQFRLVYEERYLDGEKFGEGEILAAEFTNRNNTFKAVRYTDPDDNTGYYNPEGRNMRKAFLRSPVDFRRISSRFGKRHHPTLHKMKMHKGVDYAASRGTPIKSTSNGKIVFRGRKGGYGNVVIVRHGNKYSTLYAHMRNFRKGHKVGSRVKQGEVIGYVGTTGRSTGPHLHYEFRVHGVHKNPLTVKLPKAEPLPKKYMDDFKLKAQPLLARLEQIDRLAALDTQQ